MSLSPLQKSVVAAGVLLACGIQAAIELIDTEARGRELLLARHQGTEAGTIPQLQRTARLCPEEWLDRAGQCSLRMDRFIANPNGMVPRKTAGRLVVGSASR